MKMDFSDNRRRFFKQAALFGGLALLFATGRPAAAKPVRPLGKPEPSGQGYRLTEQVRKYYETARL